MTQDELHATAEPSDNTSETRSVKAPESVPEATPESQPSPPHHESQAPKPLRTRHKVPPDAGFILTERIGKGSFATVYKGEWGGNLLPRQGSSPSNTPRIEVAVKVVQRSHLKKEKRLMDIFESEMAILKQMKHPHVVHLIDVVQTSSDYNLIMEYCSYGDLSAFIRKQQHLAKKHPSIGDIFERYPSPHGGLNPVLVRHFLAQLACSLAFLREHDIVHRDVKPQNLLLKPGASSPEEAKKLGYAGSWDLPVIKVADFGFARFLPSSSMAETLCGSPLYMAPEILNYEKYNAKADLWSVGAVTYEMITGNPPFPAANHVELIKKIDNSRDNINIPADVDQDIQGIIRGLLRRSPDERISFEDFFERTAWSDSDSRLQSLSVSVNRTESGTSSSFSTHEDTQPTAGSQRRFSEDRESSDTNERSDYLGYLRRHEGGDVAVESASPSPESSQLPGTHAELSRVKNTPNSPRGTTGDSENDYVFIEKRTVEVNSLADDLQSPMPARRRLTNPEKISRRRRLSSIAYGASPTSALAQALLKSSSRLFGAKVDATGGPSMSMSTAVPGHIAAGLTSPKAGERQIIDELEQLATIGKIVILYADIKFSQVETEDDESFSGQRSVQDIEGNAEKLGEYLKSSTSARTSLHPMHSPPSHIDPYSQLELANASLVLHLKALSILARAMDVASEWWDANQSDREATSASPGINTLVQWIRDKFNECIDRAEEERAAVSRLTAELASSGLSLPKVEETSAERLLFDRALEMAKAAAVQEMTATSAKTQESAAEAATSCEMNYGTAVWMLKALMITEKPEDTLGDDDRVMVETLMGKIAQRLGALRRRVMSNNSSLSRWNSTAGSPGSQSSQRSLRMPSRSAHSQLTPP